MKTPCICAGPTVAAPTVAASVATPHMIRIQAVPGSGTSSTILAGLPGGTAWAARDRADDVAKALRLRTGETKEVR